MLATGLCGLAANYFWLTPHYSLSVAAFGDIVALFLFLGIGALISVVTEMMHRGRRRLTRLLESIDEGFAVFDHTGRCLYVNPRAVELLARSAPALAGKTMRDVFPDIAGTPIEDRLRAAEATSSVVEFETVSPASRRWFRHRVFPSLDGFSVFFEET